jgi:hypothetical protein
MGARLRKLLLFGALAGAVGFVVLDKPAPSPQAVPIAKTDSPAPRANSTADPLRMPDQRELDSARGELFNAPPLPPLPKKKAPPVVEAPPPAPVAPPVPYRFAGKVLKGGEEEVLVAKGEFVFPVKVGDTLDGVYKVESIGNDRIEVVYTPLGSKDRITVSSALESEAAAARASSAAAQAPAAPVADGRPAQLRWEGPDRVQAGANFTVALRVNTKETLRAAPMQIRFQPDVLEPVNVRPGKFFGEGSFSYRVNPSGSIFVGATSQPPAPAADAELVIVTFKPIKRGATAELSMSALSLQGVAGRTISYEQVSAFRAAIH